MKKLTKYVIIYAFIQGVIHNLGHPITPAYLIAKQIPNYMFGIYFGVMSFGLALGGPFWGMLADKYKNEKRLILISLITYSIGQTGFAASNTLFLHMLFRFITGFSVASTFTLYMSLMVKTTNKEIRAKALAYYAASTTLGASIGYFLGGFLNTNPFVTNILNTHIFENVFYIQALLNLFYGLFVLLTLKQEKVITQDVERVSLKENFQNIFKLDKHVLIFLTSLLFINIGAINLNKFIDVYFTDLGYTTQALGVFVMTTGFVSLFASIIIVPLFAKVNNKLKLIKIIQAIASIIVIITFRASNFIVYAYSIYLVYIVIQAVYLVTEQSYIAENAKEGSYGTLMGTRQLYISLGMVIGPFIGGFIYNIKPVHLFDFSVLFIVLGILILFKK